MAYDQIIERLRFLFYGEDEWRAHAHFRTDGIPSITYDAHGHTSLQAVRNVENIVNMYRGPLELEVIHGFNHGTAIRDTLKNVSFSSRLSDRYSPKNNPGVTHFTLQAA